MILLSRPGRPSESLRPSRSDLRSRPRLHRPATRYISGWNSPNQHLAPEPLAFIGGGYVWWVCAAAFIGCAILRKVRERYPRMSVLRSLAVLYAAIVLLEFATAVFFIRAGA
jgi:hypothetical protein